MAGERFEMIFKEPLPLSESEYPGFSPRTEKANGMIIEYDEAGIELGLPLYLCTS